VRPLLIAVCVPKGGIDLNKVRNHVDDCACRRRHPLYRVECYEHEVSRPDDTVEDRAFECAKAALIVRTEAAIGVGFERGSKVFYHEKRPIITRVAAAVLITRKHPNKPHMVIVTPSDSSDYSRQLLELCKQQGFHSVPQGQKCIAHRVLLEALQA